MTEFNLFLSSGEPLNKSIVGYSRGNGDDRYGFYVRRYITDKKDQVQVEYHRISTEENKNSGDDTGIVYCDLSLRCTVLRTEGENYRIVESRIINPGEGCTDIYVLPVSETFPGQYTISFLSKEEYEKDLKEIKNNLI